MSIATLFAFEVSTYSTDTDPQFEIRMRCQGRIVWSEKTPVDFSNQNNDWPYEPSTPLSPADLECALNRIGWRTVGVWADDATDPGYLTTQVQPTPYATPHVTLSPAMLAALTILEKP